MNLPEWNELFLERRNVVAVPQPEVGKTLVLLEERFPERPLRVWDVCCGAGRNLELIASMGHEAYGSDISENGLRMSRERLASRGMHAELALADMTVNPWPGVAFHGAMSWNAIHHNTLANVKKAVANVRDALVPGGLFMLNLLPESGDWNGKGEQVEPGTFVRTEGLESGVPHHYFTEEEVRDAFEGFEFEILVEMRAERRVVAEELRERFIFPDSKWGILARKP